MVILTVHKVPKVLVHWVVLSVGRLLLNVGRLLLNFVDDNEGGRIARRTL